MADQTKKVAHMQGAPALGRIHPDQLRDLQLREAGPPRLIGWQLEPSGPPIDGIVVRGTVDRGGDNETRFVRVGEPITLLESEYERLAALGFVRRLDDLPHQLTSLGVPTSFIKR